MRTAPLFLVAAVVAATANLGTSQAFGAPQALISEFLAANSNGLRDEDGDASDWIEIHNPTAATINLEGWHLTDNDDNLDKWTFPSVEIAPGGFLMVFASKKDRARVGSELHTDFQLSSGGEYLGLVQPDLGIASEFASEYPTQLPTPLTGWCPTRGRWFRRMRMLMQAKDFSRAWLVISRSRRPERRTAWPWPTSVPLSVGYQSRRGHSLRPLRFSPVRLQWV